jgi:hypothetical protein
MNIKINSIMKGDTNGCSTTPAGSERYEFFTDGPKHKTEKYVQYDYRHPNGDLFSTVAPATGESGLDEARKRRDAWLKSKNLDLVVVSLNQA